MHACAHTLTRARFGCGLLALTLWEKITNIYTAVFFAITPGIDKDAGIFLFFRFNTPRVLSVFITNARVCICSLLFFTAAVVPTHNLLMESRRKPLGDVYWLSSRYACIINHTPITTTLLPPHRSRCSHRRPPSK